MLCVSAFRIRACATKPDGTLWVFVVVVVVSVYSCFQLRSGKDDEGGPGVEQKTHTEMKFRGNAAWWIWKWDGGMWHWITIGHVLNYCGCIGLVALVWLHWSGISRVVIICPETYIRSYLHRRLICCPTTECFKDHNPYRSLPYEPKNAASSEIIHVVRELVNCITPGDMKYLGVFHTYIIVCVRSWWLIFFVLHVLNSLAGCLALRG